MPLCKSLVWLALSILLWVNICALDWQQRRRVSLVPTQAATVQAAMRFLADDLRGDPTLSRNVRAGSKLSVSSPAAANSAKRRCVAWYELLFTAAELCFTWWILSLNDQVLTSHSLIFPFVLILGVCSFFKSSDSNRLSHQTSRSDLWPQNCKPGWCNLSNHEPGWWNLSNHGPGL